MRDEDLDTILRHASETFMARLAEALDVEAALAELHRRAVAEG